MVHLDLTDLLDFRVIEGLADHLDSKGHRAAADRLVLLPFPARRDRRGRKDRLVFQDRPVFREVQVSIR